MTSAKHPCDGCKYLDAWIEVYDGEISEPQFYCIHPDNDSEMLFSWCDLKEVDDG